MLTPEILGRTLATAPDPELARVALSRVGEDPRAREVLGREDVLPVAIRVLGFSTAAADFLVAHPDEAVVAHRCAHAAACGPDAELEHDVQRLGADDGIRRFRRRAMLRVAARDLAAIAARGNRRGDLGGRRSVLAEAAGRAAPGGLAVLALGKLGGRS